MHATVFVTVKMYNLCVLMVTFTYLHVFCIGFVRWELTRDHFNSRTEGAMAKEAVGSVDLDAVVNLDDMERAAERVMDRQDFDYFAGGARPAPSRHPSDRSID